MARLNKVLLTATLALILPAPQFAADGEVPRPLIPASAGERCVEPKEAMRRNHMDYLKHQRNATVRQGIRANRYSLKHCLECHAAKPQEAGTQNRGGHFCQDCHDYTGVRIDCFRCHATHPEEKSASPPLDPPETKNMKEAQAKPAASLHPMAAGNPEVAQ